MLSIRLFRAGKKNQPVFKIVVTDKKNPPRGGRFVEKVGFYNPLTKEKALKAERIQYWLSKGAQPSDTCHNLLVKEGIIKGKKIPVHKKRKNEEKNSQEPLEKATTDKKTEEKVKQETKVTVEKKIEKECVAISNTHVCSNTLSFSIFNLVNLQVFLLV